MLDISHVNIKQFSEKILGRNLYLYGAGTRCESVYRYFGLQNKISACIDKNNYGKEINIDGEEISVISLNEFIRRSKEECPILLITPTYVYIEIIEELDRIESLDGLETYVATLIQDYYVRNDFEFNNGEKIIPKKIHYCWFGKNPKSEMEKKCIASWKRYCPEYQIIEWNEDNYDVYSSEYMKEAYNSKKWGYVPDYARLDIVCKEGGIYLDTDVEIYRNFDDMLADEAFFNFACAYEVNSGSGFGAIAGSNIVMELRDFYNDKHFINSDGTLNLRSCSFYQNPVLARYGFTLAENRYQAINNIVLYPSEVMNPGGRSNVIMNITDKTHSFHHAEGTHRNEKERQIFKKSQNEMRNRLKILNLT